MKPSLGLGVPRSSGARPWYQSANLKLNNIAPSYTSQFVGNRYYNSVTGARAFPYTFTRATNATMFDTQGRLVWAPANLVPNSDNMQAASWTASNATITSQGITPPGGITNVYKIEENTVNNTHCNRSTSVITMAANSPVCASVYMKASDRNFGYIQINDGSGANAAWVCFDLTTGTTTTAPTLIGGTFTNMSASAIDVGNSWFRINFSFTMNNVANINIFIGTSPDGTTRSFIGTTGMGIYIAGAQVELQGVDSPKAYLPTAGSAIYGPRLDTDPATLNPLGLLIEEGKTNLIANSRNLNAGWGNVDTTRTRNQIDQSGVANSATLVQEGSAGTAYVINAPGTSLPSGTLVTVSIVAKYVDCQWVRLLASDASGTDYVQVWFDIQNGVIGNVTPVNANPTLITANMKNLGNGWYRCQVTCKPNATNTGAALFLSSAITNGGGRKANAQYILDHGQIEGGTAALGASSIIPTYGASATRQADIANEPIGSWFDTTKGSLYINYIVSQFGQGSQVAAQFDDGTTNNRIVSSVIGSAMTTQAGCFVSDAGVTQVNANVSTMDNYYADVKTAYTYELNDISWCQNGGAVFARTAATIPSGLTTFRLGSNTNPSVSGSRWIKECRYYPDASASNAQLQTLTT